MVFVYFVSFQHGGDGAWGFGNLEYKTKTEITTLAQLIQISDSLEKKGIVKSCILNYQLLRKE